jgi:hypothetical protein
MRAWRAKKRVADLLLRDELDAKTRKLHRLERHIEIFEAKNDNQPPQAELPRPPPPAKISSAEQQLVVRDLRLTYMRILILDA